MSLFSKKENTSLLINIGNGGITVSIFSFAKKSLPKLLYSSSSPFVGEKPNPAALTTGMDTLLDNLIKTALKKGWETIGKSGGGKLSHVVICFASPWFVLKAKEQHITNATPFVVSKKFMEEIVEKEEKTFEDELQKNKMENPGGAFRVVDKSVVHAKINGYIVDDIIGKKTNNFDASIFLSAISKSVMEKVLNIVHSNTHMSGDDILTHSSPLILLSGVRGEIETEPNYTLMNIDSEITDLILVEDHAIKSIASFPFGKNTIIRQIAKVTTCSPEVAESQLNLYLSKKVDSSAVEPLDTLIAAEEKEWAIYLEDALQTLSPQRILPRKTYLFTGLDATSIFVNFLNAPKVGTTYNFTRNMEIIHVDQSILSGFYQNDSKVSVDEPAVLLAIFYNKLLQIQ